MMCLRVLYVRNNLNALIHNIYYQYHTKRWVEARGWGDKRKIKLCVRPLTKIFLKNQGVPIKSPYLRTNWKIEIDLSITFEQNPKHFCQNDKIEILGSAFTEVIIFYTKTKKDASKYLFRMHNTYFSDLTFLLYTKYDKTRDNNSGLNQYRRYTPLRV